jgi:hypothetical protein|nr:MAG TPA: hypothetical protein [Caudoviricetes sp.]
MGALSGIFDLSLHFSDKFAQEVILQCYLRRYFAYDFYMFHLYTILFFPSFLTSSFRYSQN